MNEAERVVRAYYDAFNAGNTEAFLALLTDDVVHGINQGTREVGRAAFARFMDGMSGCYEEQRSSWCMVPISAQPPGCRRRRGSSMCYPPGLSSACEVGRSRG